MGTAAEAGRVGQALWALLAFGLVALVVTALAGWVADETFAYMFDQFSWAYFIGAALVVAPQVSRKKR